MGLTRRFAIPFLNTAIPEHRLPSETGTTQTFQVIDSYLFRSCDQPLHVSRPYPIQNAYPAYISWTQYLTHQARLHENAQRYTEQSSKGQRAPREGAALLQGLVTCGHCGHRMRVAYRPRARYVCTAMKRMFADAPCAPLDGPSIATFVVQAFFGALAPRPPRDVRRGAGTTTHRTVKRPRVSGCIAQS